MMPSLRRAAGAWQGLGGGRSFPRAWQREQGEGGAPRGLRLCFAPSRHGSPEHRVQGPGRAVQSPPRKLLSLGYLSIRQETEC